MDVTTYSATTIQVAIMAVTTDPIVVATTLITTEIRIKDFWGAIGLIINMRNHLST
jgi:hypothetical protein